MKTIIKTALFAGIVGLGLMGQGLIGEGFFTNLAKQQEYEKERDTEVYVENLIQNRLSQNEIKVLAEKEKLSERGKYLEGHKNGFILGLAAVGLCIFLNGVPKISSLGERITGWVRTIVKDNCPGCPLR